MHFFLILVCEHLNTFFIIKIAITINSIVASTTNNVKTIKSIILFAYKYNNNHKEYRNKNQEQFEFPFLNYLHPDFFYWRNVH